MGTLPRLQALVLGPGPIAPTTFESGLENTLWALDCKSDILLKAHYTSN
jgi:hypothetical protein